ncbi:hypothetical protein C0989_004135 [Termitomyces sp. Mn162]|nr:hypothetical protein C0989_004135 [Termitomyces sp. Mn162]
MISHQTPAPFPLITQPPTPLLLQISHTVFCLNPTKTALFPHNPTSPDLPGSIRITSHQLSAQAISARNIFECSVTNARGSCPPSKDLPSAAEPPRSAEPDNCQLQTIGVPPALVGYNGWYTPTTDNQECFQVLLQLHESRGHSPLSTAKWLHYGEVGIFTHLLHQPVEVVKAVLVQAEEPFSMDPPTSAALIEEGPSLSVAIAATDPAMSSGASSQNTPAESMELDYANDSVASTNSQLEATPSVVPSPSDAAVATNIATPAAPKPGSGGSIDTALAVSECWADIVSNEEAAASKMDEWAK